MHEDKPVGYEAARWMIETELKGLYLICKPPEIAAGIYEYYLRAYLNPNHTPSRGETTVDMLGDAPAVPDQVLRRGRGQGRVA